MMPEISLNILDVAENSTRAGASLVTILVTADTSADKLTIVIADNGCGMTLNRQPCNGSFFTTRTTRKVGLGIPFFEQEAECTGGSFSISSVPGKGTDIEAVFCTDNIDCMPLGNLNETVHSLIVMHPDIDFYYGYQVNEAEFHLDTKEMREMLGGVPLNTPEVSSFIRDYLEENESDINRMQNYPG